MLSEGLAYFRQHWMGALALFLVLTGGSAYGLAGHNSVRSDDIRNGQVRVEDLAKPQSLKKAGLVKNESFNCGNAPNQWASSRPSVNGPVGYWRDLGGVVHLSGQAARCGTPPTGGVAFVLRRGYRPAKLTDEATVNNGNFMEITIDKQGEVIPVGANDGAVVSLDGVTFRCDCP